MQARGIDPALDRVREAAGVDDLQVPCPRCGGDVAEPFYGPCTACRGQLAATLGGVGRDVEVAAYEPKMNVVPNAVATKD